jgi:hypothetical protein
MKANLIRRIAIAICLLSCISIYSCKKDSAASTDPDTTSANLTTSADDQQQVSNESDIINNDANTALNGQSSFSGTNSSTVSLTGNTVVNSVGENGILSGLVNVHQLICDATITYDTANNQRIITIVYDGTNCWGNRTRTGTVTITIPYGQHWKDAGSTATITVDALKITRLSDGKSIVLNGTKTYTNVSGGLLVDLANLQTIVHSIKGSLSVGFDNGTTRTWNVSKLRVFTYNNGIVITTTGTYSDGTDNTIAEWGTNRFGESFKSLISEPKVIRQDCDFRLVSGQNTVITDKGTSVITYGLDANGDPTGCPGSGTYYFKLVWTGVNGKSFTIIRPY